MKEMYDVAISFAGEDRTLAEQIKTELTRKDITCFYDADEKVSLWGKNIYDHFAELYEKQVKYFMIMLVSKHYAAKPWTTLERRSGQARALQEPREYILPIRIDDADIPGIPSTVLVLKAANETPETIAGYVATKIASLQGRDLQNGKETAPGAKDRPSAQHLIDKIYERPNEQRSPDYLFGYLSRSVSYLHLNIGDKTSAERYLIRSISWLIAICSKFGIDIIDAFLSKYPERCPYCVQQQCICAKTGKRPPASLPSYEVADEIFHAKHEILNRGLNPGTARPDLEFARRSIANIYPSNRVIWLAGGPAFHFLKLTEEVGEIHEAMADCLAGKRPLRAVADEVADVLAWLLSVWDIAIGDRNPDHEIRAYYQVGCPVCSRAICNCSPYGGRAQNLFDTNSIRQIAEELRSITERLPQYASELTSLLRSTESVLSTQSDPLARLTLYQLQRKLSEIRDHIRNTDGVSATVTQIGLLLQKVEHCYDK